jgi:hypothetical protein
MFIDEIDSREITIQNTGDQALTITDKIFSIDGLLHAIKSGRD